jgi:hypothetical protein
MAERIVVDYEDTLMGEFGCAWFNEPRTHRYMLTRTWDDGPVMTWIMLNPSTADAFTGDPTIRRCIRFARREECGAISVVNLFGLRATDPRELRAHPDPVGFCNDGFIKAHASGIVIAAWGAGGALNGRGSQVAGRLASDGIPVLCLGVTKDGHPKHPLARGRERVPDDAPLVSYDPRVRESA